MKLLYSFQQLRETVSNFCQKELAPYADQIDKENNFLQLRVSSPVRRPSTYLCDFMICILSIQLIISKSGALRRVFI